MPKNGPDFSSFRDKTPNRYGAYCYRRVSDPSQAERKNSLDQQERKLKEHFAKLGIPILDWYTDEGKSALKDHEAREDFWRMVEDAKKDIRVGIIAVDEESRFFRNKYMTAKVKGELLEYGIRTMTCTRDADPRTVAGAWMESIEETAAYTQSLQNREYTLRGMAGNIHQRDPKTGWAFKNGGAAPFGWKAKRIHLGHDSKGRPIDRTIWELDEYWAEIRRKILMWRKDGWTYDQIRDELNRQEIPAPRTKLWGQSTIVTTCREDMVWTAAGYAIWNKHYRKDKASGDKFKPVDDWEIEENAHPAIISEEDAQAIIAVNRKRTREHSRGERKTRSSPYLLRGNNRDDVPLFICGACGARVIGVNGGGRNRYKYVCSTKVYKGADYCEAPRIDTQRLDEEVIAVLSKRFTRDYFRAVIWAVNEQIRAQPKQKRGTDRRRSRIKELDTQLDRIRKSILAGYDPSIWQDDVKAIKEERERLLRSIEEEPSNGDEPDLIEIAPEDIEELADRIVSALKSPEMHERRQVVRSLVRQITLAPKQEAIYLELHPDPLDLDSPTLYALSGFNLVPPTGFEPVLPP